MAVETVIGKWHQTTDPRLFTADELINAYSKGQKEFGTAIQRVLTKELEENLKNIQSIGESLFASINTLGIGCSRVLLKINDLSSFKLMFMVKSNDYRLDKLRDVYSLLAETEEVQCSETFCFTSSLISDSTKINRKRVFSDGYYYCYGKQ